MDRNLLLAFVLSFAVLFGWSAWQRQHLPPHPPGTEQSAEQGQAPQGKEPSQPGKAEAPATPQTRASQRFGELPASTPAAPPKTSPHQPGSAPGQATPPGTLIQIERPLYDAVLSTRGAALESWQLKAYTDPHGDPVQLIEGEAGPGPAALTPFPGLGLGNLADVDWKLIARDPGEITFGLERDGVRLRKTWQFDERGYAFRLRLEVDNDSSATVSPRFLVDWPARTRNEQDFKQQSFALLHAGKVVRTPLAGLGRVGLLGSLSGKKPEDHVDYPGDVDWAGVQATYFLSALLPDRPDQAMARIAVVEAGKVGAMQLYFQPVELPPGQKLTREFRGYVGPKEMARLEAIGSGLDRSINLGWAWFAPLTRAFTWLLHAMYTVIPNYGLAIIILTLMVRLVTAPLTVKQMRSMERMRRVQPRMKEIQEKYKDDRQKQSEEMMRLYRTEKVNPLGGCLPMVLQLPVFIGLYYALRSSIDLRHAPFFGWITDLSAPDLLFMLPGLDLPVRLLPLVMGATMFVQQKITPMQTPDPGQARMMQTVMPLMMTVLFYQFASGLVLYWMMSNLVAILHQLWIGRHLGPPGAGVKSGSPEPKAA